VKRCRRIIVVALAAISPAAGCAGGRPRAVAVSRALDEVPRTAFSSRDLSPEARLARAAGSVESRLPEASPPVVATAFTEVADAQEIIAPDAPEEVANEGTSSGLSLRTLESWALQCNPAIRQASASAHKAMGFRQQVGLGPNPTIGFFGEQIGDAGTDQYGAFVSQDFVTGSKLQLNQNVLSHSVQSQLWEVDAQRYRVITDVRLRFYEALAAQQRLKAATEFRVVLRQGVHVAEVRKQAAEAAQPEVLLAKIQLNELEVLQQRAQFAFDAAWKELVSTIGNRDLQPTALEIPSPTPTSPRNWEVIYQDLVQRSPELKAANARVCRAMANVERQRAQPIPNVEVVAGVGHDLATDTQFGRLQAGLPVPLFNKNQGNIAAAEAEFCRAQQEYRRLQLSLSARLAKTSQEFDSARVAVDRYENQILPQADESLKLSEEAYSAGEFSFLQVLTARRTYFDASLELISARRDLAQSAASVEGLLLTGGLDQTVDTNDDDGLRGQSLSGQ
jgi:cobalt-zinc-cadmium efflux system outer membrane protein